MSGGLLLVPRMPLLFLFFVLYAFLPRAKWSGRALIVPITFVFFVLAIEILMRENGGEFIQILIRLANFSAGIMLVHLYYSWGLEVFKADFFAIVKWFPIQAVLTTLIATAFPFVFIQIPDTDIYTFLFFLYHHTSSTELSFGFIRPDGFFWEPGVFQIYLNLCLYFSLFVYENRKLTIISVVAVVCTQSTTGVFITVFLLAAFVLARFNKRNFLPTLIATALFAPVILYAFANYNNKVQGDARGSFFARQYDTMTGLAIAVEHPWIGIGFNVDTYMQKASYLGFVSEDIDSSVFDERRGNSNGISQPLYSMGFILGLFFIIALVRQRIFQHRFLAGTILILSAMTEPLLFTPFFLMIVFSGMNFRYKLATTPSLI